MKCILCLDVLVAEWTLQTWCGVSHWQDVPPAMAVFLANRKQTDWWLTGWTLDKYWRIWAGHSVIVDHSLIITSHNGTQVLPTSPALEVHVKPASFAHFDLTKVQKIPYSLETVTVKWSWRQPENVTKSAKEDLGGGAHTNVLQWPSGDFQMFARLIKQKCFIVSKWCFRELLCSTTWDKGESSVPSGMVSN